MLKYVEYKRLYIGFILCLIISLCATTLYAGDVTLTWDPPTTSADGTPLTDLAGYNVYYGAESGNYSQSIDVGNVITYQATNLTDGQTYYFSVTAYDTSGNESEYSNEFSKTVQISKVWTSSGLWHEDSDSVTPGGRPFTSTNTNSWWYGRVGRGDYNTCSTNSGELISPPYYITAGQALTFWSWEQTENNSGYDIRKVFISTDNGADWTEIKTLHGTENQWYKVDIDLAGYAEQTVQYKFTFDTVDDLFNNYSGWYIDEVLVEGPSSQTCEGYCGGQSPDACWCDDLCAGYGDCCPDYGQYCQ